MAAGEIGVYAFEVGQGSATAIISRIQGRGRLTFQAVVVDVGVSGARLAHLLRNEFKVRRLLSIVLTHNHDDHIKGLPKLVEAYAGHIGKLWFLLDKDSPPPFWLPIQRWQKNGNIQSHARLEAPAEVPPGLGAPLVDPVEAGFRLYCVYPTMEQNEAVVHGAEQLGSPLRHDQNATARC